MENIIPFINVYLLTAFQKYTTASWNVLWLFKEIFIKK